jgi:hypothetical protein
MLNAAYQAGMAGDIQGANELLGQYAESVIAVQQLQFGAEGPELVSALYTMVDEITNPEHTGYVGPWAEEWAAGFREDLDEAVRGMVDEDNPAWKQLQIIAQQTGQPFSELQEGVLSRSGDPEKGYPYLSIALSEQATAAAEIMNLLEVGTIESWEKANKLVEEGALNMNLTLSNALNEYLDEGGAPDVASALPFGGLLNSLGLGGTLNSALNFARQGANAQGAGIGVPSSTINQTTNVDTGGNSYSVTANIGADVGTSLPNLLRLLSDEVVREYRDFNERTGGSANSWYRNQYS